MEQREEIFNDYRARYKRCRYCEFLKVRTPPTGSSHFVCEIKDLTIGEDLRLFQGKFCRVYLPRVKKKSDFYNFITLRRDNCSFSSFAAKTAT